MPENEIKKIAESADMIVCGYAFTRKNGNISVFNLNNAWGAMVISPDGVMLETNMPPVEQTLVLNYWKKNAFLLEDGCA